MAHFKPVGAWPPGPFSHDRDVCGTETARPDAEGCQLGADQSGGGPCLLADIVRVLSRGTAIPAEPDGRRGEAAPAPRSTGLANARATWRRTSSPRFDRRISGDHRGDRVDDVIRNGTIPAGGLRSRRPAPAEHLGPCAVQTECVELRLHCPAVAAVDLDRCGTTVRDRTSSRRDGSVGSHEGIVGTMAGAWREC